jgi:PPOX class probable F420-dependent enzyme
MFGILTPQQRAFLEVHHAAVMATTDGRGRPHVVPVGCALIDGCLWTSGTEARVRTRHLTARPYASLTVLPPATGNRLRAEPRRPAGHWGLWLTVLGPVEIRRDDPVEANLRLYRAITGRDPGDVEEYRAAMLAERRLIYVLTPTHVYGRAETPTTR